MQSLDRATTSKVHLPDDQPLRRAVRRLRWFKSTFEAQLQMVTAETGIGFSLDTPSLTRCFIQWIQAFEAQKPDAVDQRHAYVGFASGLMLRQLLMNQPLTVEAMPDHASLDVPACFWPEGYAFVMYCLNVRKAVTREDFGQDIRFSPALLDIRTWKSFRENVGEDPSAALGFLDLFAGCEPDWSMPAIFKAASKGSVIGSLYYGAPSDRGYLPKPD